MKHALAAVVIGAIFLLMIPNCKGDNHADLRLVMEQQVDLIEAATGTIIASRGAADVVAAVDRFCAAMDQLAPKAQRLRAKYPDIIRDLNQGRVPDHLAPVLHRAKTLESDLSRAGAGLIRFSGNPLVEAAKSKFDQAMQSVVWRKEDDSPQKR